MELVLLCEQCRVSARAGEVVETTAVCAACLGRIQDDIGDLVGVDGSPEVLQRPCQLSGELRHLTVPKEMGDVLGIAPLEKASRSLWLGLGASGLVFRADVDAATVVVLCDVGLAPEPEHEPWCGHELRHRLHVSRDGEYAAVVNDYGTQGLVFEVATGRVTMQLDGGSYHSETVPFSLCFAEDRGRTVLVHRTAWNRLDVSDPASGALLTPRQLTELGQGEDIPEHYQDYFHGAIYPSPNGQRLLDDGWVWHPVGAPVAWSLSRWLGDNAWESEDGPSNTSLCQRDYYWDHGMCWVGDDLVALEGIATDDEEMIAGVRIFEIAAEPHVRGRRAVEARCFAGPTGQLFSDGALLFSSAGDGLSVWDVRSGERLGLVPGFVPTSHHRGARELAEFRSLDRQLLTWPIPSETALSHVDG
jgi:hypothetical protein